MIKDKATKKVACTKCGVEKFTSRKETNEHNYICKECRAKIKGQGYQVTGNDLYCNLAGGKYGWLTGYDYSQKNNKHYGRLTK